MSCVETLRGWALACWNGQGSGTSQKVEGILNVLMTSHRRINGGKYKLEVNMLRRSDSLLLL